jgi:hypothetical protein
MDLTMSDKVEKISEISGAFYRRDELLHRDKNHGKSRYNNQKRGLSTAGNSASPEKTFKQFFEEALRKNR